MIPSLTVVPGIKVGHWTDAPGLTGCTVVLCEAGATTGVDVRGSAPGTRETDLLRPGNLVEKAHAVLLAGGSAFGLDAASGVMAFLEKRGIGFDTGVARVPIVPGAVLFDLSVGNPGARPDKKAGYAACLAASSDPVPEGNVGAGCGATVGKILGMVGAMKSGIGSWAVALGGGVTVGALVAVNAFADVVDPQNPQRVLAGVFDRDNKRFLNTLDLLETMAATPGFAAGTNTTIGVVATNARLTKEQVNKVAQMAHNGLARTIRPVHTMFDGDAIFALSTGVTPDAAQDAAPGAAPGAAPDARGDVGFADTTLIGAFAAEAVAEAVKRAVLAAESAGGLLAARDIASEW